jgi:hypothetical protein
MLGIVGRVWLVAHTRAMIDGDEALVGIQAERILHGQFPTYFYGQAYMGSLEAYLAAPLVALLGPSGWTLRLVPIALSPFLVYLTWRLAWALLPRDAPTTPLLAGLAALVAALPPLYDATAELRTWGGQIEIYVISLALLLSAVELADRLRAGAGAGVLARRWLALGALAGLGIWINPLVSYALVTALLWLLPPLVRCAAPGLTPRLPPVLRSLRSARSSPASPARRSPIPSSLPPNLLSTSFSLRFLCFLCVERPSRVARPLGALLPALALLPGLALGGLPAWIYAVQHGGANLLVYVTQPAVDPAASSAARHGRLILGAAITFRYFTCVAPAALDGALPGERNALLPLRLLLLVPPVLGLVCGVWLVRRRAVAPLRVGLPLLYVGTITAIFCLGTSAWGATKPCAWDWAGRYAVPLALVEPLLLLSLLALPAALAEWRASRASAMAREDNVPVTDRIGANWPRLPTRWMRLALSGLLLVGALQMGTYTLDSPARTFQSPYYRDIPLDDSQLLAYLSAQHIHAAWCNHWLGNIVTYQTNGATVCADYYDQVYHHGLPRPPGTLELVSAAPRPSFILILAEAHPCLAQQLDAQGIPYLLAVLPAAGVTVITPARTVDPASVLTGLAQDYTVPAQAGSLCSKAAISS